MLLGIRTGTLDRIVQVGFVDYVAAATAHRLNEADLALDISEYSSLSILMARLLTLWLLAERPLTGYEIKKALTDDGMRFWFGLEDGSIYSVLRTLTKHGHAEIVATEQHGNRPTRTRYRITAAGRRHYRELLVEALATPALPVAAIDVALAAGGDLDPTVVGEALATRTKALHELLADAEAHRNASPASIIVDRNVALLSAELDWLARTDDRSAT